jgi:transitional endoplasmic reticulum ATPase
MIYEIFARARSAAPCIVFIDHLDVLVPERGSDRSSENSGDRIVSCFLTELDGIFSRSSKLPDAFSDIIIIGATISPHVLDKAILRPGRFDRHIQLSLPDQNSREAILRLKLSTIPHTCSDSDIHEIALESVGLSPAELDNVCREAAIIALREDFYHSFITSNHLRLVLRNLYK